MNDCIINQKSEDLKKPDIVDIIKEHLEKHWFISTVVGIAVLYLLVFLFVWAVTGPSHFPSFNFTTTGPIGDTIGGISSPIIGGFGVFLTFLAFWIQKIANKAQTAQFETQSKHQLKSEQIERIKWLMEKNRDIVANITAAGISGNMSFHSLTIEFEFVYRFLMICLKSEDKSNFIGYAWLILQNGLGSDYNKLNIDLLKKNQEEIIIALHSLEYIKDLVNREGSIDADKIRREWRTDKNCDFTITLINEEHTSMIDDFFENIDDKLLDKVSSKTLGYKILNGHHVTLGHYFRNLYHVFSLIDSLDNQLFSCVEKYELGKYLRTQLSSYEQIIIFLNSLSFYGADLKKIIEKYHLIKNIPFPLVDFCGGVEKHYSCFVYEWNEIKNRADSFE